MAHMWYGLPRGSMRPSLSKAAQKFIRRQAPPTSDQGDRLLGLLEELLARVGTLEREVADLKRKLGLPGVAKTGSVLGMQSLPTSDVKRKGAKMRSKHPFARAVPNIAEWARKHDVNEKTVRTWYLGTRTISLEWARKIEAELGIPATPEVWKKLGE